ncbi:MAG: RAD55 family ATPase [Candidatus Bathyarchaeota archaeon]|nr:RAD55 family ATPase [Candidatus Bathyarchaeota archaeon]
MSAGLFPSGIPALDVALKGGFARPSNLLVMGDPWSSKREVGLTMLSAGLRNNEAAICISATKTAEEIRARWLECGLTPTFEQEGRVKFVDCYSKMIGVNASDTPSIKRVPSIIEYTKLTVAVNEWCSGFFFKNTVVRVLFDSLSTLLIYSSLQTVMRFLHIFLGQLRKQNVLGFLIVEEGAHDLLTVNQLESFSNGAIVMEANSLRCDGFFGYPSMSVPFSFSPAESVTQNLRRNGRLEAP